VSPLLPAAELGLRRCVAFLPTIAEARLFARTLPATLKMLPEGLRPGGPLSAGFVHGGMSTAQLGIALGALRRPPAGGWSVVANAKFFTEGLDVPDLDAVLFAAPKKSVTDIVQAAGRALRLSAEARTAAIIVPAVLPGDGEDQDLDGAAGAWESVVRVVRALAAHDDRLTASLARARAARPPGGRGAGPQFPAAIRVQAPPGTSARILDALSVQIIDATAQPWQEWLALLREFRREHGHADVPQDYRAPGGQQLGHWLTRQRRLLARGALAEDQVTALDELGVTRSPHDAAWDRGLARAAAYYQAHGHLDVPFRYVCDDDYPLGAWLHVNRKNLAAGKLPAGRADQLIALGFQVSKRVQAAFQRGLDHLDAYIAEFGNARVHRDYVSPGGYRLGYWVSNKRATRKTLLAAHKAELDARGMIWDARRAASAPASPGPGQPAPGQEAS
jgi:hypothetical protein